MTQPTQKLGIHSLQGWNYFIKQATRHLPWSLTHGGNALRAVWTMTGKRG